MFGYIRNNELVGVMGIQELKNVADQHMDIVKKITVILDKAHTPSHLERFQFPQLGD